MSKKKCKKSSKKFAGLKYLLYLCPCKVRRPGKFKNNKQKATFMKVLKSTTKAGSRFVQMYMQSNCKSVRDAYRAPSGEKIKADTLCRDKMVKEGGHGYKVISFNTFAFTVSWMSTKGLRVETPTNSILVTL